MDREFKVGDSCAVLSISIDTLNLDHETELEEYYAAATCDFLSSAMLCIWR